MQKYKFTCLHVKLKSITLQCDPIQTRPCFAWSCLLCCQPSRTPNLSCREPSSCWLWWWWRWSPTLELSRTLIFITDCSTQAAKVSLFFPTSGLQALKDKRFESKLASETCYSRGGGSWHYIDNTWAQYYRGRPWRDKVVASTTTSI